MKRSRMLLARCEYDKRVCPNDVESVSLLWSYLFKRNRFRFGFDGFKETENSFFKTETNFNVFENGQFQKRMMTYEDIGLQQSNDAAYPMGKKQPL